MRAFARRLRRLEQRFGPPGETWETQRLRERLQAARRQCGLPPPSPERWAELQGMSIVEILLQGRQRAARLESESGKSLARLASGASGLG